MGEFASNAKANTAVTLGSVGLGLGVANMLGNCNGVTGFLGRIFGNCGCDTTSYLLSENAMLKSENYSDKGDKDVYTQSLSDNRSLRAEVQAALVPLTQEAHNNAINVARLEEKIDCCCKTQTLQNQILDQKIDSQVNLLTGKINETALALNGKIDTNEARNQGRFATLDQTIACIAGKVNDITTTNVSICKINPPPVPAAMSVPASGTTWYPGCMNPLAASTTTTTTPAA